MRPLRDIPASSAPQGRNAARSAESAREPSAIRAASEAAEPNRPALAAGYRRCRHCGALATRNGVCQNCGDITRIGGIIDITDEHPGPYAPDPRVDGPIRKFADDLEDDPRGGAKMLAWAFLWCALLFGGILIGVFGGW